MLRAERTAESAVLQRVVEADPLEERELVLVRLERGGDLIQREAGLAAGRPEQAVSRAVRRREHDEPHRRGNLLGARGVEQWDHGGARDSAAQEVPSRKPEGSHLAAHSVALRKKNASV